MNKGIFHSKIEYRNDFIVGSSEQMHHLKNSPIKLRVSGNAHEEVDKIY